MGVFSFVKPGKKIFDTISSVAPKVNKTKLDKAKSKLAIATQKAKASGAKLDQTTFEIKNKLPITFGKSFKKTESNTEKAKKAFKKEDKKETKTRHFYAPKNFNKGGRVGLKGGTNLGMQSVKYGLDNNPKITAADPKAKFIAANKKKKKKFESPMAKAIKKKNKKRII